VEHRAVTEEAGADGGAIFRFVPAVLYECEGAPVRPGQLCENSISDLSESPLATGSNRVTDGCVRVLSITDPDAEPSGFIFDGTGEVTYYHLQHGQQLDELRDLDSNRVDGRTDDLIRITGF
jgi:hypothetical protein